MTRPLPYSFHPSPPEEPGCAAWFLLAVPAIVLLGHIVCAVVVAGTVRDAGYGWGAVGLSAAGSLVVTVTVVNIVSAFLRWFFTPGRP